MEAKKQNTIQKREENLRKTFWKLAHARQAMAHVLASCDFYLKHITSDKHPLHVPLLCSICVMYARPFTDNAGVGMISKKFTRYDAGRLQKTNDMLWRSRKEFYAHSDATLTAKKHLGKFAQFSRLMSLFLVSRRETECDFRSDINFMSSACGGS